jgi:hypothetical protein
MAEHNGTLRELTSRAEAFTHRLMTTRVSIARPSTDRPTLDTDTGDVTVAAATQLADQVPARIRAQAASDLVSESGAQQVTTRGYTVSLPKDVADVAVGDLITVLTANDPHLPGRVLRITDVVYAGDAWKRDVHCLDTLG